MSNLQLSVCIITYNQEKYLPQALDSILNQEHNYSYEIIVGEDCSTDNTRKVLEDYATKYPDIIKPIYNNHNLGLLKNYYNVSYTEAIYYVKDQVFYFNFVEDNSAIVRVFPLEDYYKLDPDNKMKEYRFGIIYIDGDDEFKVENIENIEPYFNAIPDVNDMTVTYKKDEPVEIEVKPVKFSEENKEVSSED